jgi:CRP-like cAMP-binding protein
MKYPELYNNFKSLASIPEEEWLHIEPLLTPKSFKKDEMLIHEGEDNEFLYLIVKGLTRSYYVHPDGKEFIKIFLAENDIASAYVELLKGIPSRINVQAMEATDTLRFKYSDLVQLYDRHPCWNEVGRIIAEDFFILKEQREYEFLLLDAGQRYESFVEQYGKIQKRIPQYAIASYLGITPVSLSRILNKANE